MAIVAVQPDDQLLTSGRYQSFSKPWAERLVELGHQVRMVDLFQPDPLEQLSGCDGLMWWFAHLPFPRNFATRLVAALNHGRGFPTFPNYRTCWHFDDKVGQYYLLQAAGLPMPRTWVFWRREDAEAFCEEARFPLVLKLAGGITSENVRMIRHRREAKYWINRLFGSGVTSLERASFARPRSLLRRAMSVARIVGKGHPRPTRRSDVQRGYFLVQEFLERNDYDTRAVAIGNRAYAYRRFNRADDFRASGSGLRDADPSKIDLDMVRMAFAVAQSLGTQSIAIDGIYRGRERVLTEISYYYEGWILHEECPGHWLLHGTPEHGSLEWVESPCRPEDFILDDFLADLSRAPGREQMLGNMTARDVSSNVS
jgi:glutathione synthase/RimK-type ligase-like ATP-grasp enzyme